jgi:hypothetical protein
MSTCFTVRFRTRSWNRDHDVAGSFAALPAAWSLLKTTPERRTLCAHKLGGSLRQAPDLAMMNRLAFPDAATTASFTVFITKLKEIKFRPLHAESPPLQRSRKVNVCPWPNKRPQ